MCRSHKESQLGTVKPAWICSISLVQSFPAGVTGSFQPSKGSLALCLLVWQVQGNNEVRIISTESLFVGESRENSQIGSRDSKDWMDLDHAVNSQGFLRAGRVVDFIDLAVP